MKVLYGIKDNKANAFINYFVATPNIEFLRKDILLQLQNPQNNMRMFLEDYSLYKLAIIEEDGVTTYDPSKVFDLFTFVKKEEMKKGETNVS